eukprot:SAG22_NODE_3180_length_1873_cov_1.251973_3_plen_92_part_00
MIPTRRLTWSVLSFGADVEFNSKCQRFFGGFTIADATIYPADDGPPACEDARGSETCAQLVALMSCETDFCPTCGEWLSLVKMRCILCVEI